MLRYSSKFGIRFAPNAGGPTGGTAPSQPGTSPQPPENPFDKIDLDSLPDEEREKVVAAKEQFATLQKAKSDAERVASERQSAHDRLAAEHNKLQKRLAPEPPPETTSDRIYDQLLKAGMPEAQAKAQSQLLGGILDNERAQIKAELGRDMAPLANLTLGREAETSFTHARAMDRVGWSTNDEVCKLVWASAVEMAQQGRRVTPEVITNLAGMHLLNFLEKNGGNFASLQTTNPPMNTGRGTPPSAPSVPQWNTGGYPGSHLANVRPPSIPDPNAPKYQLDSATQAAIDLVTNIWKADAGQAPSTPKLV